MHPSPPVPAEFLAQYDAERARRLRRRATWYCISVLVLLGISWGDSISQLVSGTAFAGGESLAWADLLADTLYTVTIAAALVYFALRPRSRPEIVRAFQWVVAVTGITAVAATPLMTNTTWIPGATLDHTPEADLAQAVASLTTVFVLHFLASIFVALSPREGLVPFVPILAAFAAWVVFVSVGSSAQRVGLILAAPLAGLPGFAWSWWRYRSFTDRFHARAIQKRYAEVTRELTDARRVHEALFPPPITRGPIRIHYKYEPMREIGGDFLFVRPLSFPPSQPAGPVLVVIIDVTGHGIAAALAVNRLHAELEKLTAAGPIPSPAEVVRTLNQFACVTLAPQGMFATAFCARVTPASDGPAVIEWAGAGHPPAFRRTRTGDAVRLESTAPMLGIIDADLFSCEERRAELRTGDEVILYTDGAFEAIDSHGRELGLDGLHAIVRQHASPAVPLAAAVAAAVARHRADAPTDDTLIVGITVAQGAP